MSKYKVNTIMNSTVVTQPRPSFVASGVDEWTSGICDFCEDVPECCFAFWCCPCFACITTKKLDECLCLPLLDMFGTIPPVTMSMRTSVRRRYGIKGTMCNDCVCACCCTVCVWCQISRELKSRTIPAGFGDLVH